MENRNEVKMLPNDLTITKRIGYSLFVMVFLLFAPLLLGSYFTGMFVLMGIYTIAAVGLTLLMGYAGLVSLAQASFWGIGSYVTGIATTHFEWNIWLSIMLAIIVSAVVAGILGFVTRNMEGHYFTLATLGFGIVLNIILVEEGDWTGGSSGMTGIPSLSFLEYSINSETAWFYLIWAVTILVLLLFRNLVHSNWGRNLRSIHSSSLASSAMGINTGRFRLQAFILSAVTGGLSGALYSSYMGFISPAVFNFEMSIKFVLMVVVGGLVSIWGAVIGVVVVMLLVEFLRDYLPLIFHHSSAAGAIEIIFFGLLLIIMMIYMPGGIVGAIENLRMKWRGEQ